MVSGVSLAYSYDSLKELAGASDLVAEVTIGKVVGVIEEAFCSYYEATIDDVCKGSNQICQTIIIT